MFKANGYYTKSCERNIYLLEKRNMMVMMVMMKLTWLVVWTIEGRLLDASSDGFILVGE